MSASGAWRGRLRGRMAGSLLPSPRGSARETLFAGGRFGTARVRLPLAWLCADHLVLGVVLGDVGGKYGSQLLADQLSAIVLVELMKFDEHLREPGLSAMLARTKRLVDVKHRLRRHAGGLAGVEEYEILAGMLAVEVGVGHAATDLVELDPGADDVTSSIIGAVRGDCQDVAVYARQWDHGRISHQDGGDCQASIWVPQLRQLPVARAHVVWIATAGGLGFRQNGSRGRGRKRRPHSPHPDP